MINKIILTLLLGLAIHMPAFAQTSVQESDRVYEIDDFSAGLKSHIQDDQTPNNAATVAQNVRFNESYGSLVKREKMLQLSACRAGAVKSLHRYYKADATKYTIQTSGAYMDYIADTSGSCTELRSGLSDSKRWTWITYKDMAIGTNGTDRAQKWDGKTLTTDNTDGARTAGDLTADLGAPFAELNTGSNLDASSWYQYRVAFYDGSVYKFSLARSPPINTGSSVRDLTLTDIPIGPAGTTERIIYRTEGQASRAAVVASTAFYRVATISDNVTRTYDDTMDDTTLLGDSAPTWSTVSAGLDTTPPYAKYALIHKEQLFMANDPSGTITGKSIIYWSDIQNPDYFNTTIDYRLIRPDDGDEITVLRNHLGILTVGKTGTWSKLYTEENSSNNWSVSAPFSFIGCVAPYSAANTPAGILYLGRHGIYSFNGQSSELISDVVTDHVRDILATSVSDVAGIYHDNQYFIAYTSEAAGSGANDRVLIFDLVRNAYTMDTKNIDSWATFDAGTDFGTLYSGSSTADGIVFAHSGTFNDLVYRYKSQFDAGTFDDVVSTGTQENPALEIGWGLTINASAFAGLTINSYTPSTATINRKDLSGTWTSPGIQLNANSLDKLYWNEDLGSSGDITWAVRTAATSGGLSAASWSTEYSNPSGSDISGESGNIWVQLRATLTTAVITSTPLLILADSYVMKMTYQRQASSGETAIASLWTGGLTDMGGGNNPKWIKEIQVFYTGSAGTMTVSFENETGQSQSFDIDLSKSPSASTKDAYFGTNDEKIFAFIPPVQTTATGRKWRFSIAEDGITPWSVDKVSVRYDRNGYVTYPVR